MVKRNSILTKAVTEMRELRGVERTKEKNISAACTFG
jgi:hypothetical protein